MKKEIFAYDMNNGFTYIGEKGELTLRMGYTRLENFVVVETKTITKDSRGYKTVATEFYKKKDKSDYADIRATDRSGVTRLSDDK